MIELTNDQLLILFGMFYAVFLLLLSSIGQFFLEKARYYCQKTKELKSKKERDVP